MRKGGPLFFIVGFFIFSLFGWVMFPKILFLEKTQPIDFSHVAHGEEAGLSCEDCHYFRADGSYAGIPSIDKCMECHEGGTGLEGKAAQEEEKLLEFAEEGKEIPWLIYSRQPDNVYFSHAAHVKMAEIECNTCHGDMGEREHPPIYKKNRLHPYSKQTMAMETCEACHQERGVLNDCFVCHK
ncbi:MAG TPA: cytochrome C [Syntrophaceae bacterium]|nr:cytochrome C [Syntrophaceae bacterium]